VWPFFVANGDAKVEVRDAASVFGCKTQSGVGRDRAGLGGADRAENAEILKETEQIGEDWTARRI